MLLLVLVLLAPHPVMGDLVEVLGRRGRQLLGVPPAGVNIDVVVVGEPDRLGVLPPVVVVAVVDGLPVVVLWMLWVVLGVVLSEVGLVAPVVVLVVAVDEHHLPVVRPPVRLAARRLHGRHILLGSCWGGGGGGVLVPAGHLLHQRLGGRDGHPVAVVDGDVEELATAAWITEL